MSSIMREALWSFCVISLIRLITASASALSSTPRRTTRARVQPQFSAHSVDQAHARRCFGQTPLAIGR
jgi:hypothetical protein